MTKKYKIEISKEMADEIEAMGYTPESWLQTQLNGLIPTITKKETERLIQKHHKKELDDFKKKVKDEIKVEKG
jgi:hypothetical protein